MKTNILAILIGSFIYTSVAHSETSLFNDKRCLAMSIYYESRGEIVDGQYAVADVVLNRVESDSYPNDVCSVIVQRNQFHWTPRIPPRNESWQRSVELARDILNNGTGRGITQGSLFFQVSPRVPPYATERIITIGNHNFFL
jgi:spore germination cell wall hydrolase CwlJ-like protein